MTFFMKKMQKKGKNGKNFMVVTKKPFEIW
jgi:hypothetical protein